MYFKGNISKATFFLTVALLFSSFKVYDWEYNNKYNSIINKSITKIFNNQTYQLEELKDINSSYYTIKNKETILGYIIVADAPSMYHHFDYYIVFDEKVNIMKIEILKYRENYGAEICSRRWLKKFINISTNDYTKYNRKIDGISGATISVNSIKAAVFSKTENLKKSIIEIEKN